LKVIWTEQALLRLLEIQDFVTRANPDAAERLVHRLVERGDGLSKFPEMGRSVPELPGTGLRDVIEGHYRIVYRIQAEGHPGPHRLRGASAVADGGLGRVAGDTAGCNEPGLSIESVPRRFGGCARGAAATYNPGAAIWEGR
jgi:toxin ParE1/3/4